MYCQVTLPLFPPRFYSNGASSNQPLQVRCENCGKVHEEVPPGTAKLVSRWCPECAGSVTWTAYGADVPEPDLVVED